MNRTNHTTCILPVSCAEMVHALASIKLQGGQRLQAGVKSACEEQKILQVDYVCLYK